MGFLFQILKYIKLCYIEAESYGFIFVGHLEPSWDMVAANKRWLMAKGYLGSWLLVGAWENIEYGVSTKRWSGLVYNFTISWITDQPLTCDSSGGYHDHHHHNQEWWQNPNHKQYFFNKLDHTEQE